jgi:hypothetical protein
VEVEDTGESDALFVSAYGSVFREKDTTTEFWRPSLSLTYDVSRKSAMILRISVSLFVVSSNPGVSIKTTRCPSRWKAPAVCTASVQDCSPLLTARLDPLTRFTNCVNHGGARGRDGVSTLGNARPSRNKRTVDFPVPVAPMTLLDDRLLGIDKKPD